MSSAHFVYIPLAIGLGVYLGWMLGARSVRQAYAAEERRRAREEQADIT